MAETPKSDQQLVAPPQNGEAKLRGFLNSLPEKLKPLAEEKIEILKTSYPKLESGWMGIRQKAADIAQGKINGEIHSQDFTDVEAPYNTSVENVEKRMRKIFLEKDAEIERRFPGADGYDKFNFVLTDIFLNSSEKTANIPSVDALNEIFKTEYIGDVSREKRANLVITPQVKTKKELIVAALEQYPGFAITGQDTQKETAQFIKENSLLFKEYHVTFIGVEFPPEKFETFSNMTSAQLRTLANDHKITLKTPSGKEDVVIKNSREMADQYGLIRADDVWAEWALAFAAAKDNGIPIINIDKNGAASLLEEFTHPEQRIPSTNFVYVDKTKAALAAAVTAEEALAKNENRKPKPVKFVMAGGLDHFINSQGLADEGLHIPLFAFTRAESNGEKNGNTKPPIFEIANSPNGPNVYLPAGQEYFDTKSSVKAQDFDDGNHVLAAFAKLPGVEKVREHLQKSIDDLRKKAQDSRGLKPKDDWKPGQHAPEIPKHESGQLPLPKTPSAPADKNGKESGKGH